MIEKPQIKDKPILTIKEAALYFNIGENKLRTMCDAKEADYVIYNGVKRLIKKKRFEAYLERAFSI